MYILYIFCRRYVLEKVDLVIVGAEGVVESGGIINKVGSVTTRWSGHVCYDTSSLSARHHIPVIIVRARTLQ